MAIVGKSPREIQTQLDNLYEYSKTWGLQVNTDKTKIMVFRKRGGLLRSEKWTYNGIPIEGVDKFNYFGLVFKYTGNCNINQEHLAEQALNSTNLLLHKCTIYDLK